MSATRTVSRWLLWISVALLASPGLAAAQNAVLYEVTETMRFIGRDFGTRKATAALMGTVNAGTALCPEALGAPVCSLVAEGTSTIDLSTGTGLLDGKFAVVVKGPGQNPVDAPELVIARGRFSGQIDLSPAVLNGWPLGWLKAGTWSAKGESQGPLKGLKTQGTVTGVFRLPFVFGVPEGCLDDLNPSDCWYVSEPVYWVGDYAPADVCSDANPIHHQAKVRGVCGAEHSLAVPTVRLEATFTETYGQRNRRNRSGNDD